MIPHPTWNLKDTKELILELYGKPKYIMAAQSLNSTVDRLDFARFHFHEAMSRWDAHLIDIQDCHPLEAALGSGDEETDARRARRLHELAAHVQACVHCLHTIPDILAHALYYGLALDVTTPLGERQINARNVASIVRTDSALQHLYDLFVSVHTSTDFKYLDALSNHGKHRSLVRTSVWWDMTGKAPDPVILQFSEFSYDGDKHDTRDVRPFLVAEYERISRALVDCGMELWNILKLKRESTPVA